MKMENTQISNLKKNDYKKAEFYIKKYLEEIALHFNMETWEINKILIKIIRQKYKYSKWWEFLFKEL